MTTKTRQKIDQKTKNQPKYIFMLKQDENEIDC